MHNAPEADEMHLDRMCRLTTTVSLLDGKGQLDFEWLSQRKYGRTSRSRGPHLRRKVRDKRQVRQLGFGRHQF